MDDELGVDETVAADEGEDGSLIRAAGVVDGVAGGVAGGEHDGCFHPVKISRPKRLRREHQRHHLLSPSWYSCRTLCDGIPVEDCSFVAEP